MHVTTSLLQFLWCSVARCLRAPMHVYFLSHCLLIALMTPRGGSVVGLTDMHWQLLAQQESLLTWGGLVHEDNGGVSNQLHCNGQPLPLLYGQTSLPGDSHLHCRQIWSDTSQTCNVREKRRRCSLKDYTFWRQFNEKPGNVPGCPVMWCASFMQMIQWASCICMMCAIMQHLIFGVLASRQKTCISRCISTMRFCCQPFIRQTQSTTKRVPYLGFRVLLFSLLLMEAHQPVTKLHNKAEPKTQSETCS